MKHSYFLAWRNLVAIHDNSRQTRQIMEEVASDNRTHMADIGKEYQEMVNQLITVGYG